LTRPTPELTFSCPNCAATGRVGSVDAASEAACLHCGKVRPLRPEAIGQRGLEACPWCSTGDLYVQKDFPQGLGLFIILVGFAISTVFWYYEMPIPAYLVLVASVLLDYVLYHTVGDVTICYRCLSQVRGSGANPDSRFKPFDLAVGERYRQERLRIGHLRQQGGPADRTAVESSYAEAGRSDAPPGPGR
jgi:hypothetical protein